MILTNNSLRSVVHFSSLPRLPVMISYSKSYHSNTTALCCVVYEKNICSDCLHLAILFYCSLETIWLTLFRFAEMQRELAVRLPQKY